MASLSYFVERQSAELSAYGITHYDEMFAMSPQETHLLVHKYKAGDPWYCENYNPTTPYKVKRNLLTYNFAPPVDMTKPICRVYTAKLLRVRKNWVLT